MRHKIAKALRREILKRGATIEREGWCYEDKDGEHEGRRKAPRKLSGKDKFFEVVVKCNGWTVCSPDDEELSAYRAALDCVIHDCGEPFEEWKKRMEARDGEGERKVG